MPLYEMEQINVLPSEDFNSNNTAPQQQYVGLSYASVVATGRNPGTTPPRAEPPVITDSVNLATVAPQVEAVAQPQRGAAAAPATAQPQATEQQQAEPQSEAQTGRRRSLMGLMPLVQFNIPGRTSRFAMRNLRRQHDSAGQVNRSQFSATSVSATAAEAAQQDEVEEEPLTPLRRPRSSVIMLPLLINSRNRQPAATAAAAAAEANDTQNSSTASAASEPQSQNPDRRQVVMMPIYIRSGPREARAPTRHFQRTNTRSRSTEPREGREWFSQLNRNMVTFLNNMREQQGYDRFRAANNDNMPDASSPGLSLAQVNQLPMRIFNPAAVNSDDQELSCAVCLCDYELDQVLRRLPCTHEFHAECVDEWLMNNRTCPFCRYRLYEPPEIFPNPNSANTGPVAAAPAAAEEENVGI